MDIAIGAAGNDEQKPRRRWHPISTASVLAPSLTLVSLSSVLPGILLVYDVTDEQSFQNIRNWIRNIEQHAADNVNKILVGNKVRTRDEARASGSLVRGGRVVSSHRFFASALPFYQCDMMSEKLVETARGQALADEYGIKFFETSAKSNINVVEGFTAIATDIKKRLMDNPAGAGAGGQSAGNVKVSGNQGGAGQKEPSKCCN